MKEITLPIELANQIMAYLGTRPYQDVAGLIAALQQEAHKQELAIQEQMK
jgi:hypothetical protein